MSKKKRTLNASTLRTIFLILLLATAVGGAGLFTYTVGLLKGYAVEVSHKKADAAASTGNVRALVTTQKELEANKDVLEKVGLLKSSSQFPEFQVVDEIKAIASRNNIQIASFSYGATSNTGAAAAPGAATTPTTPTPVSTGGKTIALSVTFTSPSYLDFLQFTYDIEQHLPKMKIQGIDVSSSGASIAPLNVEMYIQ